MVVHPFSSPPLTHIPPPPPPPPSLSQYGRTNNPTRCAFERAIASAEAGAHALSFASGLAATVAVLHLLKSGDNVICIDDVYGGTQRYFRRVAEPNYGITFDFVDFNAPGELARVLLAKPQTKLVWLETPTNPTLKVTDIASVAAEAHKAGAILVVDNTFMSPYFQKPLGLGADVVVHSVTKYSEFCFVVEGRGTGESCVGCSIARCYNGCARPLSAPTSSPTSFT
jgi:cystathionine gamma-lyase